MAVDCQLLSLLEENLWELGDYLEYFNTVSSAKIN